MRTSRDAPTGHKLFKFIPTSFQPRRWAHIKRSRKNEELWIHAWFEVDASEDRAAGVERGSWGWLRRVAWFEAVPLGESRLPCDSGG